MPSKTPTLLAPAHDLWLVAAHGTDNDPAHDSHPDPSLAIALGVAGLLTLVAVAVGCCLCAQRRTRTSDPV